MFPAQLYDFQFYQKKKDILLYRAKDHARNYFLKSIIAKDDAVRQAFYDEYESLSQLVSPSLPIYYGIEDNFRYPDQEGSYLTLCMEDCSDRQPLSMEDYSIPELLKILHKTGKTLLYLLSQGILYTDLNPSNILIDENLEVTLLDFTYCYYFLRNPRPAYPLRFSYNLTPSLKGHQLLIQELALLLQQMIMEKEEISLSSSVCLLLETGLHPSETLLLPDYLVLIEKALV
ncbi:MAG: hypothetical protein Q4E53_02930 [Eubacteriales bacterium]|nr:hypothetical protein [Eubacteriales bacterium]